MSVCGGCDQSPCKCCPGCEDYAGLLADAERERDALAANVEHLQRENAGMRRSLVRYRKYIAGLTTSFWRIQRGAHRQLPTNALPIKPPTEPEAWPAFFAEAVANYLVGPQPAFVRRQAKSPGPIERRVFEPKDRG